MLSSRVLPLRLVLLALATCALASSSASAEKREPWQLSPWFDEESFTATLPNKVRIHVNAPAGAADASPQTTRLILYALPNGNTIEQTLGCQMSDGMDWHYDIQHVAAQVRLLRSLMPVERIVLVCAEAPGLSWPAFRRDAPDANAEILRMANDWRRRFGRNANVTLTGHSGGGAFMLGVIQASDEIPQHVDRIAFLDANYSFDAALHAAKLERWLKGGNARRLIVLAYDDREITFQGKKVVGPDGGTFRATGRMREALGSRFELAEADVAIFKGTSGLDGRIRLYVHPNPQNKILHTALVGDMNGLVHVQTLGTAHEETWGKLGGPRAYEKWIQPEPTPSDPRHREPGSELQQLQPAAISTLPPRPANAMGGAEFIESLNGLSLDNREAAILRELMRGNFPHFLRDFKTVTVRGQSKNGPGGESDVEAMIEAMPDYLSIGSDDDFVRMPMTPQTAQKLADRFGCTLPTRKIVDAIDAQAELHLAPHPLTQEREAVGTFLAHHRIIEQQRGTNPLGLLITGIKKDIVLSPRIFERPQRLAIYGWRQLDGKPIQPLTIVHWHRYVDYSHGARLVRNRIEIRGHAHKISDVLQNARLCHLVSDEGPMKPPRYPEN